MVPVCTISVWLLFSCLFLLLHQISGDDMSTRWLALTNHTGFHLDDLQVRNSYWKTLATAPNTHTQKEHTLFLWILRHSPRSPSLRLQNSWEIRIWLNPGRSETVWKGKECFHMTYFLCHNLCLLAGSVFLFAGQVSCNAELVFPSLRVIFI